MKYSTNRLVETVLKSWFGMSARRRLRFVQKVRKANVGAMAQWTDSGKLARATRVADIKGLIPHLIIAYDEISCKISFATWSSCQGDFKRDLERALDDIHKEREEDILELELGDRLWLASNDSQSGLVPG